MSANDLGRKTAAIGATVLAGGALAIAGGTPAMAAPTCGATEPAATVVAPGVCQVVVTESGTFTAPSGLSKLSALVVGAGGSAFYGGADGYGFGGGGGEVVYVDQVSLSTPATVTVGSGAPVGDGSILDGGSTRLDSTEARGGKGPFTFASGNGNASGTESGISQYSGGGGAAGAGQRSDDRAIPALGGAGYSTSSLPGVDPVLFPAIADDLVLGQGGTASGAAEAPGVGFGGGAATSSSGATAGGDGVIIFRYAALDDGVVPVPLPAAPAAAAPVVKPTLAETGVEAAGMSAAGLGAALLGAAALLIGRRRSTRAVD